MRPDRLWSDPDFITVTPWDEITKHVHERWRLSYDFSCIYLWSLGETVRRDRLSVFLSRYFSRLFLLYFSLSEPTQTWTPAIRTKTKPEAHALGELSVHTARDGLYLFLYLSNTSRPPTGSASVYSQLQNVTDFIRGRSLLNSLSWSEVSNDIWLPTTSLPTFLRSLLSLVFICLLSSVMIIHAMKSVYLL